MSTCGQNNLRIAWINLGAYRSRWRHKFRNFWKSYRSALRWRRFYRSYCQPGYLEEWKRLRFYTADLTLNPLWHWRHK